MRRLSGGIERSKFVVIDSGKLTEILEKLEQHSNRFQLSGVNVQSDR